MSFEDEYVHRQKKKNPITPFLPALGLILAVALGAISYVLSEPVHTLLIDNISNFPTQIEVQYVVAVGLFATLILLVAMIYAAFAPKPPKLVSETELKKERDAKAADKRATKRKRRKMQIEEAKAREKQK